MLNEQEIKNIKNINNLKRMYSDIENEIKKILENLRNNYQKINNTISIDDINIIFNNTRKEVIKKIDMYNFDKDEI